MVFFVLMTYQRESIPEVSPFAVEDWSDQTGDTFIADINALAVGGAMKYVGQRQIFDFSPEDGPVTVGSEGFSKCSGLLLGNQQARSYTFSHLEPFAEAFHDRMRTGSTEPVRWPTLQDAVLIYGSLSSRQVELERLLLQQFWGPATLRTVHLETGNTHWGMTFNGLLGQLAVVRKKPDHSIFRYQLFEPIS
jgi:hypothetical protein